MTKLATSGETMRALSSFYMLLTAAIIAVYAAFSLSGTFRGTGQLRKWSSYALAKNPSKQFLQSGACSNRTKSSLDFEKTPTKVILAWTKYFSKSFEDVFKNEFLRDCIGGRACTITANKSLLEDASAVLFHARDVNFKRLPPTRSPDQYWIILNLESPVNAGVTPVYDNLFNLTVTYRNDSDVPLPYGYFERRTNADEKPMPLVVGRKSAYWLVSNCEGSRMTYVRNLTRHLDIDIFGRCSGQAAAPRLDEYEKELSSRYAFYLAFENSQCSQYVTEKFWKALSQSGGAIPIVLGAPLSDYNAMAPPNSFVHVDNFSSPLELAKFLKKVSSSESLFAYYHGWRRDYSTNGGKDKYKKAACSICRKLHTACGGSETAARLSKWFNTGCRA